MDVVGVVYNYRLDLHTLDLTQPGNKKIAEPCTVEMWIGSLGPML